MPVVCAGLCQIEWQIRDAFAGKDGPWQKVPHKVDVLLEEKLAGSIDTATRNQLASTSPPCTKDSVELSVPDAEPGLPVRYCMSILRKIPVWDIPGAKAEIELFSSHTILRDGREGQLRRVGIFAKTLI